jgi:PAS domain S-box-containing protein
MTRRVVQRAADGTPLAFVGVALDVTQRIETQRRTEALKRRFELAAHSAGIGHWVLEKGADRGVWSERLREAFGLPADAPVPCWDDLLRDHIHPEDRGQVGQEFSNWVRSGGESHTWALRALRPDGTVRHLVTHSLIEKDGPTPLLFGVVIDVTQRQEAERALRSALERAALAARGAGLATWEIDQQTGQVFWDEQMWLLRGHPPQQRAMTDAERMACVHPDDRSLIYSRLAFAMNNGLPFEQEFRVVWPDGQVRWLATRSVAMRDEHTGAQRRIGVNWDTTDKRSAEAARRERELALGESQAKSKFLARMSHELRTPLNAVLGFSQLLLAEETGGDPASASRRRRVDHIHAAGRHLLRLINDVLDLSSLESGELHLTLTPVALAPLVAQTLPLLGTLGDDRAVTLVLGALDFTVMADETRLRQALLNLLTNALKYNRPGGQVKVEALAEGPEVVLRVSDTGQGMRDDQLRHLFEPFNRLGRRSDGSAGSEGTGIGLAIVKALMERMGGAVRVQSQPGVGSVFELRLAGSAPAVAEPARAAEPPAAAAVAGAGASPHRATLLYVEDNPVNALIISELLAKRSDLRLHLAETGASGVAKAVALQPDLVLLDMQLPDFDGHEVMRRLREHPRTAQVPVIALSANAMPENIERALHAGMADYWTKPLDFRAFMASIEGLFGPPQR